MTTGEGVLFVDRTVKFIYNGAAQVALPQPEQTLFEQDLNLFILQQENYGHHNASSQKVISTAIKSTAQTLFEQNFVPWKFHPRHSDFKPGLTGWAQVKGDYSGEESGALEKLQYDLFYIKHRSLFLDINIILKTLSTVLSMRGQ